MLYLSMSARAWLAPKTPLSRAALTASRERHRVWQSVDPTNLLHTSNGDM